MKLKMVNYSFFFVWYILEKSFFFTDGTDLTTPRVFKIHPNTTYVGRDAKAGTGKQYFYVTILTQ